MLRKTHMLIFTMLFVLIAAACTWTDHAIIGTWRDLTVQQDHPNLFKFCSNGTMSVVLSKSDECGQFGMATYTIIDATHVTLHLNINGLTPPPISAELDGDNLTITYADQSLRRLKRLP